jgi:hypothetical protein
MKKSIFVPNRNESSKDREYYILGNLVCCTAPTVSREQGTPAHCECVRTQRMMCLYVSFFFFFLLFKPVVPIPTKFGTMVEDLPGVASEYWTRAGARIKANIFPQYLFGKEAIGIVTDTIMTVVQSWQ